MRMCPVDLGRYPCLCVGYLCMWALYVHTYLCEGDAVSTEYASIVVLVCMHLHVWLCESICMYVFVLVSGSVFECLSECMPPSVYVCSPPCMCFFLCFCLYGCALGPPFCICVCWDRG